MKRLLAMALIAALPACALEGASTTSTTPSTSTSTVPGSTTSASTTFVPTTTTVPVTTTSILDGNWADYPVITSSNANVTLGWWNGSEWIQARDDLELPIEGGENYQVALIGSEGRITTGGPQVPGCDIYGPEFGQPGIALEDPELLTTFIESDLNGRGSISGVAISAPWDIHPRPAVPGEWHPDLENLAFELLADRGFVTDSVNNVQSTDADLDGDGSLETLLVIEDTRLANSGSGVYSMLFVVSPSSEEVQVVAESVIPPNEEGYPASFRVSAVADLSGDGVMEVVVDGVAWEASRVTVYELTDSGFVERIGAGCGV